LSPFASQVDPAGAHWVSPVLVGDVQYRTVSPKGLLRYPAWRGLRNLDKTPAEVLVEAF
jgi:bifunctional non-homologous end joining protein LigD